MSVRLSVMILLAYCLSGILNAQSKVDLASIRNDLNESTEKLTRYRDSVSGEKIELARKLAIIQTDLAEKRRQSRLVAMGSADRKLLLGKLDEKASAIRGEVDYLEKELDVFYGKIVATMYKGEKIKPENEPRDGSLVERMKSLEVGIERLEMMLGGAVIDAEVADDTGKIQQGKIASFGPVAWFANESGDVRGVVVVDKSTRSARLIGVDSDEERVSKLIAGEEVSLEVDLTGGKAKALASIRDTPLDLFNKGGVWVWPIIGIAMISLVCAVLKFFQLAKIKNPEGGWLVDLLEHVREGDISSARSSCDEVNHPIGGVMHHALLGVCKGADVVEDIVYEQMIDVQGKLQKWLPFIAVTAAIAPLLGLLGTVSGMIGTFNSLSVVGTGDPKLLSGGISEALVTTMFGLVVAIPALILHSLLSRRSQGIIQTTEKIGLTVVNSIRKNK